MHQFSPGDTTRAAQWAAAHASLDNLWAVARLLEVLRAVWAPDAAQAVATRAVSHVSLDHAWAVGRLLMVLRSAGAGDAVQALATRAAADVSLHNPAAVRELLEVCVRRGPVTRPDPGCPGSQRGHVQSFPQCPPG